MNPFLFALVIVRLLGIYLVAEGAVQLGSSVISAVTFTLGQMPGMGMNGSTVASIWLAPVLSSPVYIGVGLVLVLRATKWARLVSRGAYPAGLCQRCGYNLAASGLAKCPECGDTEVGAH